MVSRSGAGRPGDGVNSRIRAANLHHHRKHAGENRGFYVILISDFLPSLSFELKRKAFDSIG